MDRIQASLEHIEDQNKYVLTYLDGDFPPKDFTYQDPKSMQEVISEITAYADDNMLTIVNIGDFPEFNNGEIKMVQCMEHLNTRQIWRILESIANTQGKDSNAYSVIEDIVIKYGNFENPTKELPTEAIEEANEALEVFSLVTESQLILEMDLFDVTRRDLISFKDFLKSTERIQNPPKRNYLKGFTREIKRHKLFTHPTFDSTYDAIEKSQTREKVKKEKPEGWNPKKNHSFEIGPKK